LPLAGIGPALVEVVGKGNAIEPERNVTRDVMEERVMRENEASGYACPECHGALWEFTEGPLTEYRCRTGHIYSPESLLPHLSERSREELESTQRALAEEASMAERMVERASVRNASSSALERLRRKAAAARARADLVGRAMTTPADGSDAA